MTNILYENVHEQNLKELRMLQSYVKYQENVKTSLDKSINGDEIIVEKLVLAISYNDTSRFLSRYFSAPTNLDTFYTSLHTFLFQMIREIEDGGEQDRLIEQIKILVHMLNEYEKTLGFTYSDSAEAILEKLKRAEEEVITPFFNSEENPIFNN